MPRVSLPTQLCPLAVIQPGSEDALLKLDRALIMDAYRAHGAVLLRGFDYDLAAFRAFCRDLCPTAAINESPGRLSLGKVADVQSVDLGQDAFPLHPELSREPWKPDTAFFACMASPAPGGGETTVCDGVALAAALPTGVRNALADTRLRYIMPTWPGLFEFWLGTSTPDRALLTAPPASCPYQFEVLRNGQVVRSFSRPALHRPMFADQVAFGNFLLFARHYLGRSDFPLQDDLTPVPHAWTDEVQTAAENLTFAHGWQQSDVLMLDNTRFMHGRRAIENPLERNIVTYFGYLAGALVNPEEPIDPVWRRRDFTPPRNPAMIKR